MISNLLMASGKNSVSTVDLVDPFGDGSGIALYKFDGDATDESGAYNGTASNVTYATGKFGNSIIANGVSSVSMGIHHFHTPKTISLWAKNGFACQNGQVNNAVPTIYFDAYTNAIAADIYKYNTTTNIKLLSVRANVDNSLGFNHYVLTIDYPTVKLYFNGDLVSTGTLSENTTQSYYDFGLWNVSAHDYSYATLEVDQFRIFNRALTAEEIIALYEECGDVYVAPPAYEPPIGIIPTSNLVAFYPLDTNARDAWGVYEGIVSNVTFDGTKATFNGSSSYISCQNTIPSVHDWSMSFWANEQSGSTYSCAICIGNSDVLGEGISIQVVRNPSTTANQNKATVHNGAVFGAASFSPLAFNTLYHVTVTYSSASNTYSIYVNSVFEGSGTMVSHANYYLGLIRIGMGNPSSFFKGTMSRVAIFNKALTQEEVTALYNEGQS